VDIFFELEADILDFFQKKIHLNPLNFTWKNHKNVFSVSDCLPVLKNMFRWPGLSAQTKSSFSKSKK